MKRRLLLMGLGASGALVLGWGLMPPRSRLGSPDRPPPATGPVALNGWIQIEPEGLVRLAMNRSEMGQGVHTALAMLVAEELDVSLAKVQLVQAAPTTMYGNVAMFSALTMPLNPRDAELGREPGLLKVGSWLVAKVARELGVNATATSTSVIDAWEVLPLAAATARAQLLGAAALQWKLPRDELVIRDGVVSHPASQRSAHFGQLARMAAAVPVGEVSVKDRNAWTLIGSSAPRSDLPAKVDGSARFGIDTREPDQLYAVIRHSPMLGGSPGRVDADAAMQLPGVERVVRLGPYAGATAGVAVVGRSTWHAMQGAAALQIEWQAAPNGALDSQRIALDLAAAARAAAASDGGLAFHTAGDVRAASTAAARRIEALYQAPYLAHQAIEPINCTARVKDGRVDVWVSTQVPERAREIAARVAEVSVDAVNVHVTYLGGSFGRRLEVDVVAQAVRIAIETGGRPVQLLWSREEDTMHDFYRPAAAAVMQASLDAFGAVSSLAMTSASDAIMPRWLERNLPLLAMPIDLPDKTSGEGLLDLPYGIANVRMAQVATHSGVPVGFWRSVGHSHNAFFLESFIDELADQTRQDPVAFRLSLLGDMPRHAAVLKLAADKAQWGQALPAGLARGVALHESYGSVVAQVVEASLQGGRPHVHRVVCAADIGTVVNPGIVAQQIESAVIFGLSAALYGRINIVGGVVQQRNFPDSPVLTLAETPRIETHLIASRNPPGGVGEIGTPPLAPALANALFALTGQRLRSLPLVVSPA